MEGQSWVSSAPRNELASAIDTKWVRELTDIPGAPQLLKVCPHKLAQHRQVC
jgi:hypothetical protein